MVEKKILIVDFDSKSLEVLVQLFEPYDFKIIKASDGISAYESFTSEKPDLVILEAMLPKLHGFDLAKKISHETKGKTPVIIVTGLYRGPQYRNEALNYLGASDYFEKPFDKSKLVESALNLLEEGEELTEDLPSDEAILENLSKRIKTSSAESKREPSPEEKKEVEPLDKTSPPEKAPKKKKRAGPKRDDLEWGDSAEKAFSEIEGDVLEEISSLVDEKKEKKDKK